MTEVLKQLIKEAVLEALMEFANQRVAVVNETEDEAPKEDDGKEDDKRPSHENSGGGTNNGRPKPDVGVGAFGLR